MAMLTMDGRKIPAEDGQTILDAARGAGVEIPTLCWYPKLSIVGNCRICLVSVEGEPKLIPACAAKVADGMVVTTRSHAAVENRKGVLRLVAERYPAINGHPRNEFERYLAEYDVIPTAVEGRDLALRSGDERPGDPMIRHDMSTCILCTRCVRACEDIQVVGVLDVGFRGEHAEIIVGADGDPDKAGCTGCGECVRLCSTRAIFEVMPRQRFEGEGRAAKPGTPPRATGKSVRELPLLERLDMDIRDRVATPDDWYSPFRESSWEEALDLTAQEMLRIKAARGPDALACFSSAKCSNEENYLMMRMFRGALGTNNVDHCTRLCHSTSVAAMQRAINTAAASGSMREIEQACDVIFIAGANTTESHPVFGAALKRAHESRAALIVADPRRTELAGRADIHLQMQPGTDVALYSAMLNHILGLGLENRAFIDQRTHDFDKVRAAVQPYTPERSAKITGIPAEQIKRAAEIYARGPNTSTLWAMGLTQHANGTDIVTSLLNLMFACGMIGRWGAAMLPIRGQNNVQGASDMGAIPFVYTDYQPVGDRAVRDRFAQTWHVPAESLSLATGLMITEVVRPESAVRGMYIMGENPIISDPDIAHAERWFQELEFLAVHDLFLTETARYADVVLPGSSFAEKTGTFVNTERRIQIGHKAIDSPGDARSDLDILIDLSNRLGLPTTFRSAQEVMQEIATVTPSWAGVTYERLEGAGLQYPVPRAGHPGTAFLFDDAFPTADGRAKFVPVEYTDPVELPDDDYPFVMNTGRQLYHWHTGTMTRRASGLDAREPTPIVEIHPADAKAIGVREGELLRLTSRRNSMVSAARITERVARGQVFVPFHFREAAANLLTNPVLDPYAKMAELQICAVRIEPERGPAKS